MTDKIIRTSEGLKLVHQMTDRDRLAEKLFIKTAVIYDDDETIENAAKYAVESANIFFDTLEANTDG